MQRKFCRIWIWNIAVVKCSLLPKLQNNILINWMCFVLKCSQTHGIFLFFFLEILSPITLWMILLSHFSICKYVIAESSRIVEATFQPALGGCSYSGLEKKIILPNCNMLFSLPLFVVVIFLAFSWRDDGPAVHKSAWNHGERRGHK